MSFMICSLSISDSEFLIVLFSRVIFKPCYGMRQVDSFPLHLNLRNCVFASFIAELIFIKVNHSAIQTGKRTAEKHDCID